MTDSRIDWPGIAEAAVTALLGEPNRKLSRGRRWRYGTKGSLSVDLDKAAWFDFEGQAGGGLSKLVEREIGGDWKAARRWLEDPEPVPATAALVALWRPQAAFTAPGKDDARSTARVACRAPWSGDVAVMKPSPYPRLQNRRPHWAPTCQSSSPARCPASSRIPAATASRPYRPSISCRPVSRSSRASGARSPSTPA